MSNLEVLGGRHVHFHHIWWLSGFGIGWRSVVPFPIAGDAEVFCRVGRRRSIGSWSQKSVIGLGSSSNPTKRLDPMKLLLGRPIFSTLRHIRHTIQRLNSPFNHVFTIQSLVAQLVWYSHLSPQCPGFGSWAEKTRSLNPHIPWPPAGLYLSPIAHTSCVTHWETYKKVRTWHPGYWAIQTEDKLNSRNETIQMLGRGPECSCSVRRRYALTSIAWNSCPLHLIKVFE